MLASEFAEALGCGFFAGVPDSLLRSFCDFLYGRYGIDPARHVVAANEGNAVALAAGYHLATGRVGCVYMQNSGQGNAVNPLASLASPDVYAVPLVLVVGWRGEPGTADEPQHAQQGRVTLELLDVLGIPYFTVGRETDVADVATAMAAFQARLDAGECVAFVVRKGAFEGPRIEHSNGFPMLREEALGLVAEVAGDDPVVCTTGKASRELYEIRERSGQGHGRDFLAVGSMGHASSIAMGMAAQMPGRRVWCVDGDGAVLMHMGALAVIGAAKVQNLVHVVVNNGAHESVGGTPTAASGADLPVVAKACGYRSAASAGDPEALERALAATATMPGPVLIEARCSIGSRDDLGRPASSPIENKEAFMSALAAADEAKAKAKAKALC